MTSYPIPYVITRSSAGERSADIYSRRLAERIIYLGTPIDDVVANVIIAQLLHLDAKSGDSTIGLYTTLRASGVGDYDAMQYVRPGSKPRTSVKRWLALRS